MVVKTIVVRNLFSFEYEGSNPSLPTIKYKETCILFSHKNKQMFRKEEPWNLIPTKKKEKEITNKSTINLGIKTQKYRVEI